MIGSVSACAAAQPGQSLAELEALLAHEDSATLALAQWCRARGLANDPSITARRLAGDSAPSADVREWLQVAAGEPLGYRHVELTCGDMVLSDARNWYVPARLATPMIDELASGDRPFGAVIAPLGFRRERLGSRRGAGPGCPAGTILTNRALIRLRSGEPLAFVVECYQPALLGAAPG